MPLNSSFNSNSDGSLNASPYKNLIRQSAVSMSVGQKEGATQIVKDWLDSEGVEENENSDNGESEE